MGWWPSPSSLIGRACSVYTRCSPRTRASLQSYNSLVIGPGLGRGASTTQFVAEVLRLRNPEHSLVIDADGLVAIAELPDWPRLFGLHAVLTPHTGELAVVQLTGDWPRTRTRCVNHAVCCRSATPSKP